MNAYARFDAACQRLASWAPLPLRLGVGIVFLLHGIGKANNGVTGVAGFFGQLGIPLPAVAAVIVITVETVGAASVALGLLTRFWAACMAIEMVVAILLASLPGHRGFELEGLLLAGSLALVGLGDGPVSLRGLFRHGAHRPAVDLQRQPAASTGRIDTPPGLDT
jgi:putative oxidoreductase